MVTHTAETCLGVLRQAAKNLLKGAKSGSPVAFKFFEQSFENPPKNRLELKQSQAQLVIARECGFTGWQKLKSGLELWQEQNELPPYILFNTLIEKISLRIATDDTGTKSTPEKPGNAKTLYCRFCSKSKDQVEMPITTPNFSVCVDCVDDYYRYLTPFVPGIEYKWEEEELDDFSLRCDFCHKTQSEVKKLIAGPQVFICDECVGGCNEILRDEGI